MRDFDYELRRGEEILATGRMLLEDSIDVGSRVRIGRQEGVVESMTPTLGNEPPRIVVQLR